MKPLSFFGSHNMKQLPPGAVFFLLSVLIFSGCSILQMPGPAPKQHFTETGLAYTIIREGNGAQPGDGDLVTLHYKGYLSDGTLFDSTYDRQEPVQIVMGSGELLPGMEEGIALLQDGSKARLVIPPELAYGDVGFGKVPENETLTFELTILRVYTPDKSFLEEEFHITESPSGVRYAVVEPGNGIPLEREMRITLHYTGYIDDASQTMFDSSRGRDEPFEFILGRRMVLPGWEEVLPELNVGDQAKLWIPYTMAYGERGRGPIPPQTDLVFDIEILDGEMLPSPTAFPVEGKDTIMTRSGLRYIIVDEGAGDPPMLGQVLEVHYSGYLSDGTLFDSSVQRSEPIRFVLGAGQVLTGWDEAFIYLSQGSRARLIIPPHLAYGNRGSGPIPPGETLIFDVELVEIHR
ncbi:MAG: hypothetical protein EA394_01245 [Bacteroidia bacterium]|nr:MAG: hypothetical protein EA394_01245 [Bacteroidia bacterium]